MVIIAWYKRNFLNIELVVGIVLGLGVLYWGTQMEGAACIDKVLQGNRAAVYGTLASIFGSLLGFAIAAVSIVLGFISSRKLETVRKSRYYPLLWRCFVSSIRWLGIATIASLVILVVDRDANPAFWAFYAMTTIVSVSSLRVFRAIWILESVIKIMTASDGPDVSL